MRSSPARRARHARARRRRWPHRAAVACCALALGVGLAIGGHLAWFFVRDHVVGGDLLDRARTELTQAGRPAHPASPAGAGRCAPPSVAGILAIPAVGLVAPVVQGDGDAQLAVAVGHVPTSAWPGGPGTAVLAAHDVTWFHGLGSLRPGAIVEYRAACSDVTYRVTSAGVVKAGTPVANRPGQLALVTCWPLDALWYTGTRLLVLATQTGGSSDAPGSLQVPTTGPPPPIAVAAAVRSVDTLAANPTPLGTLSVIGTPARTWTQSPAPLADAAQVQDLYFAALRAAEAGDAGAWSVSAPGVALGQAAALVGARIAGFGRSLTTSLWVAGDRLVAANVTVGLALDGGPSPGTWLVEAHEQAQRGTFVVTSWQMRRTG